MKYVFLDMYLIQQLEGAKVVLATVFTARLLIPVKPVHLAISLIRYFNVKVVNSHVDSARDPAITAPSVH